MHITSDTCSHIAARTYIYYIYIIYIYVYVNEYAYINNNCIRTSASSSDDLEAKICIIVMLQFSEKSATL